MSILARVWCKEGVDTATTTIEVKCLGDSGFLGLSFRELFAPLVQRQSSIFSSQRHWGAYLTRSTSKLSKPFCIAIAF